MVPLPPPLSVPLPLVMMLVPFDPRSFPLCASYQFHPPTYLHRSAMPSADRLVVTHTDSAEVFLWNCDRRHRQGTWRARVDKTSGPSTAAHSGTSSAPRGKPGSGHVACAVPDVVLTGHRGMAQYALDLANAGAARTSAEHDAAGSDWTS